MTGVKNLKRILKSINPSLDERDFVFISITKNNMKNLKFKPLLMFEEKEGVTLIVTKEEAVANKLSYENFWSLITLTVHSDLNAVGFLAIITQELAKNNISVNVVSAFYHDHLFVIKEKSREAYNLIKNLSNK